MRAIMMAKAGAAEAAASGTAQGTGDLPVAGAREERQFEDFLNSNPGSAGTPETGNDLPGGQARGAAKRNAPAVQTAAASQPAAVVMTAATSVTTRLWTPPRKPAANTESPNPAATTPDAALAAALAAQPAPISSTLPEPTPREIGFLRGATPDPAPLAHGSTPPAAPAAPAASTPSTPSTLETTIKLPTNVQSWAAGSSAGPTVRSADFAAFRQSSSANRRGNPLLQSNDFTELPVSEQVASIGTAAAKQDCAMAIKAQFQESEASVRGNPAELGDTGTASHSPTAPAAKPPAPHQEAASDSQQPPTPGAPAPAFATSSSAFAANTPTGPSPATTPQQPAATTTLNQVLESADKMRSDGKTHVEVQVKLDDGQQVTVRLQMSQGSVHPIFKTESPELRQAIEQNWAGFRSGASERGLEIATPVFESPGSEGGFNAFANRDQSQQYAGDPSEAEGRETLPKPGIQAAAKQPAAQPSAAAPTGSGVQVYA